MDPAVLVAGEALVDFIPRSEGPLATVECFERRAGGAPANVAAALAALGEPAWLATRLGADAFGEFLAETLAERGVPDRFVQRDPERQTALAFVASDAEGGYTFRREGTADLHLDTAAVPDAALDAASVVCVGGVMLAAEPGRSATFELVARARRHDCTVVFDPNSRPELWDGDRGPVVDRMLGLADVLKVATDDRLVAGTATEAARSLLDAGPGVVVVTRGADGAFGAADGTGPWPAEEVDHPGYAVDAVDATGAGDAFLAGLIAARVEGRSLTDAVDIAAAVGALATTETGAMAALPTRDAVATLRAEN
jgi:fructokinase